MTLSLMMTESATTQRRGAPEGAQDKTGGFATWLENVSLVPVQAPSVRGQQMVQAQTVSGMPGVNTYRFETYTESHTHDKDSVEVTELPDIRENDKITIAGITYIVKRALPDSPTFSFGKTLYIFLDRDNT